MPGHIPCTPPQPSLRQGLGQPTLAKNSLTIQLKGTLTSDAPASTFLLALGSEGCAIPVVVGIEPKMSHMPG